MDEVETIATFTAAALVLSVAVHPNEVVAVNAVMLETVAVPPDSVTVPHTIRGDACAVLEHVVVVPQVLTLLLVFN